MRLAQLVLFLNLLVGAFFVAGSDVSAQSCGGDNGNCATISECSGAVVADDICGPLVCCLALRNIDDPSPPIGGDACAGTCRGASWGCTAPEVPDSSGSCSSGQVCCVVPSSGGASECDLAGGVCRTASFGCIAPEQPSVRTCLVANQLCCEMSNSGGPVANACTVVPGARCARISDGCMAGEVSAARGGCSSGQMCCDLDSGGTTPAPGTPGNPAPGTPGNPAPGTPGNPAPVGSTCVNKVAGVCFPTGTGLSEKSVLEILTSLLTWLLGLFGLLALIGFIISGLQYLFATGDEGMAETAKRNMKYCVFGILVALSGYIIIRAIDTLLKASPWI